MECYGSKLWKESHGATKLKLKRDSFFIRIEAVIAIENYSFPSKNNKKAISSTIAHRRNECKVYIRSGMQAIPKARMQCNNANTGVATTMQCNNAI